MVQVAVTVKSVERLGLVQVPLVSKFDPERVMTVPTLTLVLGVNVISGTIVRVVTALSPRFPVTCMAFVSTAAGLFTVPMTNEPVTTPPDMEHDGVPAMTLPGAAIVQLVSPVLNPVPETEIVFPPLPLLGVREMVAVITVKVVVGGLPPDAPGYPPE
jgi:hypothetical protein